MDFKDSSEPSSLPPDVQEVISQIDRHSPSFEHSNHTPDEKIQFTKGFAKEYYDVLIGRGIPHNEAVEKLKEYTSTVRSNEDKDA